MTPSRRKTEVKVERHNEWRQESERLKVFWNSRYAEFSLRESGNKTLTPEYNELMYRCKKEAYRKALKVGGVDVTGPVRILDGGCGQGFFASVANQVFRSAAYTGVDISEKAVAILRTRFPDFEWVCADLSGPGMSFGHLFDIVQSIDLLYLVLDDKNHFQAIRNMVANLVPKGVFIITDTLPGRRCFATEYIVFRPLDYYERVFDALNLQLLGIFPMYYWLPDMGVASGPLKRVCRLLPPKLVFAIDRLCLNLRLPQFAQSDDSRMKMIVCRKGG